GEDQPPGAEDEDRRAERGRDQRRDAEYDGDRGELEAGLPALEQVADDRPRQDAEPSGGCPLHQTKGEQRADRGRERRAGRTQREQDEGRPHDPLAAEAVGERADDDRRAREAGDEDGDRRRRFRLRRAKIGLDQRQAWQRHVDRQRRQGGQHAEKEREPEPANGEPGHRTGAGRVRICGEGTPAAGDGPCVLSHARGGFLSFPAGRTPAFAADARVSSRARMASERPMPASTPAVASAPAKNASPMTELRTGAIGRKKPITAQATEVRMRNKAFAMTLTAPRLMAATRRLMNQRSAQAMMNAATGMEGLLVSLPFSAGLPGRPNGWRAAIP